MNAADIAIQALPTAFIMSGSVVVPARRMRLPIREALMTIFTSATLAAPITSNHCVSPAVAPVKVGNSHHESGLNALAIHNNVTECRYAPASAAEAVLRAMEDEDDPALSDCVAAAWDGAGG
jgi:hypothetical protein